MKHKLQEKVIKIGDNRYQVKQTTFKFLAEISRRGFEGIVFYGAGGDINEWVTGITDLLKKDKIGAGEVEDMFSGLYTVKTTGGRIDLVMVFNRKKPKNINIGKMAIWRLQFGDCSWLSDYVVNYKNQHEGHITVPNQSLILLVREEISRILSESTHMEFDADSVWVVRVETDPKYSAGNERQVIEFRVVRHDKELTPALVKAFATALERSYTNSHVKMNSSIGVKPNRGNKWIAVSEPNTTTKLVVLDQQGGSAIYDLDRNGVSKRSGI